MAGFKTALSKSVSTDEDREFVGGVSYAVKEPVKAWDITSVH